MRIQACRLSKRFGGRLAVDDLSFTVEPGRVTGFLGPNGAGKSTTLFDGRPYRDLPAPQRAVGAVLDARAFHPGRSARDHLLMLVAAGRLPDRRVGQVLGQVGLEAAADRVLVRRDATLS